MQVAVQRLPTCSTSLVFSLSTSLVFQRLAKRCKSLLKVVDKSCRQACVQCVLVCVVLVCVVRCALCVVRCALCVVLVCLCACVSTWQHMAWQVHTCYDILSSINICIVCIILT